MRQRPEPIAASIQYDLPCWASQRRLIGMLLLHHMFNFYNLISLPIAGRFLLIVSLSIFSLCHYLICWLCFLFCLFSRAFRVTSCCRMAWIYKRSACARVLGGHGGDMGSWDPGSQASGCWWTQDLLCKCCSTNVTNKGHLIVPNYCGFFLSMSKVE